MKVYGLTGGVGMGKSTSSELLRERGVAIVDTDVVARQLVEPGQPALAEIQAVFGPGIVNAEGKLQRGELARIVFDDATARRRLENVLHPRIRAIWKGEIQKWRAEGLPRAVVVIPLLFETKAEDCFDATICVACTRHSQQVRLLARGWEDEHIKKRIQAQWPIEKKMALADYVVWTEGDMEAHAEQLGRIIN